MPRRRPAERPRYGGLAACQAKAAQDALLTDPQPLTDALLQFTGWFTTFKGQRVWSQGGNFDEPLLSACYHAVGMKAPWKFWDSRDTRTVYDLNGFNDKTLKRAGTYHNALDDAKHQIACVAAAIRHGGCADAVVPQKQEGVLA